MEYQEWNSDPTVLVIVISIMVLSKLIIFTLVTTYYGSMKEIMKGKSSPFYYFFWGCHCTTFLAFVIGNTFYIARTQENKLIVVVFILSTLIDVVGAVILLIYLKLYSELLPVPLTSYFKLYRCGTKVIKFWESTLNFVAFFLSFFFISSILQTVPNILISYYAFPSRTLIATYWLLSSQFCVFGSCLWRSGLPSRKIRLAYPH